MSESQRILVVDDEPRGVELLVRALRSLAQVETASHGDEGWARAARGGLDLVLSDQRMPGMSGVELLSRVAEHSEETGRVLLTGYADLAVAIDAINAGRVHAYLTKPCPPEQLRSTVRAVLERVRLARENRALLGDLAAKNRELEEALRSLGRAQERVLASERLAAIGRMIAMIVHDLRGPLSVIRSSGDALLREGSASSAVGELAREILSEAERVQRFCAQLLEETRAGTGGGAPREEELDELVGAALAHLVEEAGRAGVQVELELRSGARVAVDEDRLRRALLNLAYNALEAMPDGGLLRVATRREGARCCISLVDSGSGIPEEIRDRLFDPFVTAGKRGGSGLGLAVVKKVVDDHGGEIEVGKAEGGGTAFHLRLPVCGEAGA